MAVLSVSWGLWNNSQSVTFFLQQKSKVRPSENLSTEDSREITLVYQEPHAQALLPYDLDSYHAGRCFKALGPAGSESSHDAEGHRAGPPPFIAGHW